MFAWLKSESFAVAASSPIAFHRCVVRVGSGENVTRGRSPSVTFSTEGRHNFRVPRTTVCHMFCRMASYKYLEL